MKKTMFALLVAVVLVACHNEKTATIDGQFFGAVNKNIVLEELSPVGGKIVDSIRSNADGKFKFKIDFSTKENPTFYNVRYNDQYVPLLLEGGEHVEISAVANIYVNYEVKGSKGSELLREYTRKTIEASLKLDSINRLFNETASMDVRTDLGREYSREYVKLKQATISFVMKNSSSLAAVVPLYQPMYDGAMLFDQPTDFIYFKAIADSLETRYPTSPYVKSLRNDIKKIDNVHALDSIVNAGLNSETKIPEIKMKDAAGNVHSLAELEGKIVLLVFTSSSDTRLKILNRELLDVYKKYHDNGFEIFEVSVDSDKVSWLRSITENKLPWIRVCDFNGTASVAVVAYNVKAVPAYFLIGRDGNLVNSKFDHNDVEKLVAGLINQ